MNATTLEPAAADPAQRMPCGLCSPGLGPVLDESEFWRLILNRNQNLLGKCFLVTRRHLEAAELLSPAEWSDLHTQLIRTTGALRSALRPDHFNCAFLQNQDRHVHFHFIPRYAAERKLHGLSFTDPDYPDHYAVPAPVRLLDTGQAEQLAGTLRAVLRVAKP